MLVKGKLFYLSEYYKNVACCTDLLREMIYWGWSAAEATDHIENVSTEGKVMAMHLLSNSYSGHVVHIHMPLSQAVTFSLSWNVFLVARGLNISTSVGKVTVMGDELLPASRTSIAPASRRSIARFLFLMYRCVIIIVVDTCSCSMLCEAEQRITLWFVKVSPYLFFK